MIHYCFSFLRRVFMETKKIIERETVDYSLEGTKYLVKSTYNSSYFVTKFYGISEKNLISRELIKSSKKLLNPITKYALEDIILSGQPIFVLKKDSVLYYTKVSKKFSLGKSLILNTEHACSCGERKTACKRLLSVPDEEGGCSKVRDFSTNIQNYDYITDGYETHNVIYPIFFVSNCEHKL